MPYTVRYTDNENKTPITVFDNTSNTDSSLTFPGRNVSGYGQIVAENFLALLENFAGASAPINPTEGQLWFNSDPSVASLLIWDGSSWKAASGVQKSLVQPSVEQSKVGELWVDTINQQLFVFSGTDWILVGPNFSTGLRSGLVTEQIVDSTDSLRVILSVYVEDKPIIIISKDSFTPKLIIPQFPVIRAGITIASPTVSNTNETDVYQGGFLPKLYGTARSADSLTINGQLVDSTKFLRVDTTNVIDTPLGIRADSGVTIGSNGTLNLSTTPTSAKIYNSSQGSSIDLQLNTDGIASTVVRLVNGKVGINTLSPTESLDVTGNVKTSGKLIITDNTATTSIDSGSLQVAGGIAVAKNAIIDSSLTVNSQSYLRDIIPQVTEESNIGSITRRWNTIFAKNLVVDEIRGSFIGGISGNANTASSLTQQTTFALSGDITAPSFVFNGAAGGLTKTFNTSISPAFITSKPDVATLSLPQKPYSLSDDYVLVYRPSISGLVKASRDVFVGDLGLPIGAILPYSGTTIPSGFLLCDGAEVVISQYPSLYQTIGITYNGTAPLVGINTFRLPDLRGRFALGRDNMDNSLQLSITSGNVDAGGGNADRVPGVNADTTGGVGGNSAYTLAVSSLPNHEHNMVGSTGQQYYAVRSDTSVPVDSGAFLGNGGTTVNRTQYLPSSGRVKSNTTDQPYSVMNPFLTINYLIRTGTPAF